MKTDITAKIYKKAFGVDLDDKDVNKHVKAVISCKSSMLNPCRVCPAMFSMHWAGNRFRPVYR